MKLIKSEGVNIASKNDILFLQRKLDKFICYFDAELNLHNISNHIHTMAKPYGNLKKITERLAELKIKVVISLDLKDWDYLLFSNLLKQKNIHHICCESLEIDDFYNYGDLPPEKIMAICNNLRSYDNAMIHCRGGNGRSGVIACAILLLERLDRGYIDPSKGKTSLLKESNYSDALIECFEPVKEIATIARDKNKHALERWEDIETLNDFYQYLIHGDKI